MKITAHQAKPGDVVQSPDKSVYQYDGDGQWSQMEPVLTESGPLWSPSGHLTLVVRDGKPVKTA